MMAALNAWSWPCPLPQEVSKQECVGTGRRAELAIYLIVMALARLTGSFVGEIDGSREGRVCAIRFFTAAPLVNLAYLANR